MLQLLDVTLKRGNKELFEHLDLTVHAGHRVGIIGRNGIGKTTLFTLVRGRLLPDDGTVLVPKSWQIAYLAQETEPTGQPALEWVLDGDKPLRRLQQRITAALASDRHASIGLLYDELAAIDGYTAEARAGEILHGLGFEGTDFSKPARTFSGGWRIRLNLAQTLMCRSDLLLLDEPTNHLDLDATLWLERWMLRYPGTLLLISHDRDFLDRVITDIAHIEGRRVTTYRGNYSSFESQRADNLARANVTFARQQVRRKELEGFIARFKAKASKAKQAASRMKALERLTASAPAHVDAPYHFSFPNPKKMSNPLLSVSEAAVGYGEHVVLRDMEVRIYPGSRIGLLGRNGAGKTTLIRTIAGELSLMRGTRTAGSNCTVGYFAQHQLESLQPEQSPLWHLQELSRNLGRRDSEQRMRNFLGGWGFSGDMALEPVAIRSGGEKARVALALIAWTEPAILLLDEPTNHLDLDMRHALTIALQTYEGAIVVVSHDRALLRTVADEFWLVAGGVIAEYDGTLEDYGDWLLGASAVARAAAREDAGPESAGADLAADKKAKRQDAARRRAATQPLRDELKKLDALLSKCGNELAAIHVALGDQAIYAPEQAVALADALKRQGKLRRELAAAEERWLHVSEQLEADRAEVGE